MTLAKAAPTTDHDVVQFVSPPDIERVEMGMAAGAMRHLLDRLTDVYSDPIAATVREVVSNAIDATVLVPEADREPVRISMPTSLRSTFMVTDSGVGMTPAIVRGKFSQYGASTKTVDFSQVGAFGLGAKSPLSYCTEFNVLTTRDGVTTAFVVARLPEGNITKILSIDEDSDLPNGTTVTIPVRMSDVEAFNSKIEVYRRYSFDVPVLVDGKTPANEDFVLFEENFEIHRDEEANEVTTGRIWVRRDRLASLFLELASSYDSTPFTYVLSGWAYGDPANRYGQSAPAVVVELKPGVVDFSTSRDEITLNDRVTTLTKRVRSYLGTYTPKFAARVFELYREFGQEMASDFAFAISVSGNLVGDSVQVRGLAPIPVDNFTTAEGYNPLALMAADYKPTVYTAYITAPDARTMPNLSPDLFADKFEYTLKTEAFKGTSVADSNSVNLERLQSAPKHSLAKILLVDVLSVQRMQRSYNRSSYNSVVVLESPSEQELKRLQPFRKLFASGPYNNTVFMVGKKGKELSAQIALVRENTPLEISVKTVDELLTEGKLLRLAARKTSPVTGETPMALRAVHLKGQATAQEVTGRRTAHTHVGLTPSELQAENAMLVLTDGNHITALIGAANAGVVITDRPIYTIAHRKGIRAVHYKALEDYEGLIAAPDFNPTSKISETVVNKRTYSGRVLTEELLAASPEDIVASVLRRQWWNGAFVQAFAAYLKREQPQDKELSTIIALYLKGGSTVSASLTDDEIKLALKPKLASALLRFQGFNSKLNEMSNLTTTVLSTALRNHNKFDEPIAEVLFAEAYKLMAARTTA